MIFEYNLNTKKEEMININSYVKDAIEKSGVENGTCIVYCPHTTAAITINENADPDVKTDMLSGLDDIVKVLPSFRHFEGNSTAHIKSSLIGASETLIIENREILRGIWQGVYFMEFDGPRNRRFFVKVSED